MTDSNTLQEDFKLLFKNNNFWLFIDFVDDGQTELSVCILNEDDRPVIESINLIFLYLATKSAMVEHT